MTNLFSLQQQLMMMEQQSSCISCFWWRYINGGGSGSGGTPLPSISLCNKGNMSWISHATPSRPHRLLMMMKSVGLHAVCLAPGLGCFFVCFLLVFFFFESLWDLKRAVMWLLCVLMNHTSEAGVVNRSLVDLFSSELTTTPFLDLLR